MRYIVIRKHMRRTGQLTQALVWEVRVFGFLVAFWTIETEKIPQHAWLCNACFGDTGGWVSKFLPLREVWK